MANNYLPVQIVNFMARSIKDIATEIRKAFISNSGLQELYGFDVNVPFEQQFSHASVEDLTIGVVATAAGTVENLVEMRESEIDRYITAERYGYKGWYERMARAFQLGDDVNELEEKTYYDVIDVEKQIIKFSYCEQIEGGILLKVAKSDNDGEPEPLSTLEDNDEFGAVLSYINRVKPAGIKVTLRSESADLIDIALKMRYNHLVFTSQNAAKNAVEKAIKEYLKSLSYNGEFVGMQLIDAIQTVPGIEIVQTMTVAITHAGYSAVNISNSLSYIPYSGYIRLNELSIDVN